MTSENEDKIEESEGEENKKTIGGSAVKQTTKKPVDSKVELNTALSQTQRNLGTIVTND